MLGILVYLLVLVLVIAVVIYVVDALAIPDPLNKFIKIAAVVVGCIIVVVLLLRLIGVDLGGTDLNLPG
jgi:hypothetical protein